MSQTDALVATSRSEEQIKVQFAEELRKQLTGKRILFGVGAVVLLAAVLPLVVMAVKAGLALAAAATLAVGGLFAWKMVPYWLLKHENRIRLLIMQEQNAQLARLKAEAKKNPIETAENEYLRRSRQYEAFKKAMESIGGRVTAFGSKLSRTKSTRPTYDLSQETAAHEKMKLFYQNRMDRLQLAFRKLEEFKAKIDEANVKWEFQLDANAAIRAMNATDQEARINEILTEVSFDTVQQEFDAVFAKLDVDAAEMSARPALEFGQGITIDVPAMEVPEFVPLKGAAR